jgi:Clostripain family
MMFLRGDESSSRVATLEEGPQAQARGKTLPANWSVLAYLAGDNDLEGDLLGDLKEMERVGSRPGEVEIVAQVDRARGHSAADGNWKGTRRYYVTRSESPKRIGSTLLAELGETNTGDPRVVQDFLTFGAQRYPAQATMLILSNHGSGFYVPPEMLSTGAGRVALPARRLRQGFFRPTREWLPEPDALRGIAYDDGSGDCLDNRELKQVVAHAHRVLGRPLDIVGMDACLMTMLEVAYQVRDHAKILVGSQELEPAAGWPYVTILGDLVRRPAMTPAELGATIVRRYAEFYGADGPDITQSAIDLGTLDDLVGAVDALARALLAALPDATLEQGLYRAWRRTLRFYDDLYVDLHHFAVNLAGATSRRDVRTAALEVQRAIEAEDGPIIAEQHGGARMRPARGLSIYFPPFRDPSAFYRELEFARTTRWAEFLEAYLTSDPPDTP